MALKDRLLVASLGATMVSCNHADFRGFQSEKIEKIPHHLQVSHPETQEQQFQKNYRYLHDNASGAWFSFGDKKVLQESLYKISSFPMGREIIAGIPPNLEFSSTHFMPSFSYKDGNGNIQKDTYGGLYNWIDNKLDVHSTARG